MCHFYHITLARNSRNEELTLVHEKLLWGDHFRLNAALIFDSTYVQDVDLFCDSHHT